MQARVSFVWGDEEISSCMQRPRLRVEELLAFTDTSVDRVHSVQFGNDDPIVICRSSAAWGVEPHAYIPEWLDAHISEMVGSTLSVMMPPGTRDVRIVLKAGPLHESMRMPLTIEGARHFLVVESCDRVGDALSRIRAVGQSGVRMPRGTLSIRGSLLRPYDRVGDVMRRHPGSPIRVSMDCPIRAPLRLIPKFDSLSFSIELSDDVDSDDEEKVWETVESAPLPSMSVEIMPDLVFDADRQQIWHMQARDYSAASFACSRVPALAHSLDAILDALEVRPANMLRGRPIEGSVEIVLMSNGLCSYQFVTDEPLLHTQTFRVSIWGGRTPDIVWFVKSGVEVHISIPFI